jgi:hypothetical protein
MQLATFPVEPGVLVRYRDEVSESQGRLIFVRRGNNVLYPWYMARHNPLAIEDLMHGPMPRNGKNVALQVGS